MTHRHLPIKFSPLRSAVLGLPWKARCGAQQRGLATAEAGTEICAECSKHRYGQKDDPNTPLDVGTEENEQTSPLQLSVSQALDKAKREQSQGVLTQAGYNRIVNRLDNGDRYPFNMALVGHQIRVRTGAVNVVDREEPMALGNGDTGTMGPANLWSSVGVLPSGGEMNDSPAGTTELEHNKPRRTEGDLHEEAEIGNNLRSLTAEAGEAFSKGYSIEPTALIALLNEGVGLEYSQQLRYQHYSEILRLAYRDPLAEEFLDHAMDEAKHAAFLARRVTALGGKLDYQVETPEPMDPDDPEVLGHILTELWKREQTGLEYYLDLREACGTSAMRHAVEEILARELEHSDDLLRLGHRIHREAQAVGGPTSPFESNAKQWSQSYSDENDFEGLDKMGDEQCSCGVPFPPDGDGKCTACGKHQPLKHSAMRQSRVAAWQRKAEAVKRKTHFAELPVHIEWEPGDVREGVSPEGIPWERQMHNAYGFIPNTEGADGEPLDVYLGGSTGSRRIFIVNQKGKDGSFDEEKVMLGFSTPETAEAAYRSHYPRGGNDHFDSIHEMGMDSFLREYVNKEDDSGYRPKIVMKQVPIDDLDVGLDDDAEEESDLPEEEELTLDVGMDRAADHHPGDSDGCGGGSAPPKAPTNRGYGKPQPGTPAAPQVKPALMPTSKPPPIPDAKQAPWDDGTPAAPAAPGKVPGAPMNRVDTSKVMSPAEQAWNRDQGHGKKIHDQMWRLLGGPGFNPNQFGINSSKRTAAMSAKELEGLQQRMSLLAGHGKIYCNCGAYVVGCRCRHAAYNVTVVDRSCAKCAEQYETPVTGPQPTEGEPGGDGLMAIHATELDVGLDDAGLAKYAAWVDRGVG